MRICDHVLVMIEKYTLGRGPVCMQELEDMTAFADSMLNVQRGTVQMFLGETVKQQVFCYSQEFQSGAVLG